jgi:intraflagellar transport protein 140
MSIYTKTALQKGKGEKIMRLAVSNVHANPSVAITTSNKIYFYSESGDKLDF